MQISASSGMSTYANIIVTVFFFKITITAISIFRKNPDIGGGGEENNINVGGGIQKRWNGGGG